MIPSVWFNTAVVRTHAHARSQSPPPSPPHVVFNLQGLYHEDMTIARHHPGLRTKTSLRDIERNFRVFVMGVENMSHFVSMAITEGAISRVESFYGEVRRVCAVCVCV